MRFVITLFALFGLAAAALAQHVVVTTTPDLARLVSAVGGTAVRVTALARGPEDPHFLAARPSLLTVLRSAEVLVETGRELEIGWLPLLVDNARNARILPGQPGRIDASTAVRALGVPEPGTDRSAGDVHAGGNPHYLLDPLCGLQVATLLRDRFTAAWPAEAATFAAGHQALRRALAVALVGEQAAARYDHDAEQLLLACGRGTLSPLLREHGDALGGWAARLEALRGRAVVADHDLWLYLAERFGFTTPVLLEPRPGVPPSTAHLQQVVATARERSLAAILVAPYFPPQHAELVAKATGLRIAAMLHQPGGRGGDEDYVGFVDHNVQALAAALQPAAK